MSVQAKIEVKNLCKEYGNVRAVTDVSFSVGDQQVLGFLGPNGAGKTTVMKILTGFHFPSGGKAFIDGIPVDEQPLDVKNRIGYLPENVPLYGDLTVDEYLSFVSQARSIPKKKRASVINESLEACSLTPYRSRRIDTLSKGYRQRAGLAQAILHDPPILILDEPTTGLDPNQIIEIRSLIKELGKRKTVILSTHILQEVEAICSKVLIINDGRVAALGRPEDIAGAMKGGDTWELVLKQAGDTTRIAARTAAREITNADAAEENLRALKNISNISAEDLDGGLIRASFFISADGGQGAGERIFDWAVDKGYKILQMNRKKISIEDIFVKLTSDTDSANTKGEQ